MKYIRLITIALVAFTLSSPVVMAQCQGGTANGSLDPITAVFQFFTTGVADEYQSFTAVFGEQYEFSYCPTDGGSCTYDSEITINDNTDTYAGGYNDDGCGGGLESHLLWIAPNSGTFRIQTNVLGCGSNATTSTLAYRTVTVIDIEEQAPTGIVKTSPNPTSGRLSVSMADFQGEKINVTITDVMGRVIISDNNLSISGSLTTEYDLSELNKGMYVLAVGSGDQLHTERVVVQ